MLINNISGEGELSKLIFITGGTKSGKSEFAEYLGKMQSNLTYIALSEERPNDANWQKKVSLHSKRRPKEWKTIVTTDLITVLKKEKTTLIIDSIGGFIMKYINLGDKEWLKKKIILINLLKVRNKVTLIVGEQVGLGLVSEYEIGNRYIERIGELQKEISTISGENWLTVNGRAIQLENISFEIPR